MSMPTRAEYGIMHVRIPGELHRGPMTHEEAREWIDELVEMGAKPDAFYVVSRDVSDWSPVAGGPQPPEPPRRKSCPVCGTHTGTHWYDYCPRDY